MGASNRCLPPTTCLPTVRAIRSSTEEEITAALSNVHKLYCPLRLPPSLNHTKGPKHVRPEVLTRSDSGYASQIEDEDEDDISNVEEINATLRADTFERDFAVRWLTSLIARADEVAFSSDETRCHAIDEAAFILSSFSDTTEDEEEEALTRDFSFPTSLATPTSQIKVRLNDAPLSTTDHTDVGLQSWGASIILSGLMCESPARFGIDKLESGSTIVELGAGTGLVSLTLAKILPHIPVTESTIVATDYHPAVLENLRSNVTTNFPSQTPPPVHTALLDWSAPLLEPPLDESASMLFAADVIYDPEHATWLRDCAGLLLAPGGVFWLIVTVRVVGKFEGIAETVDHAFSAEDAPRKNGRMLTILSKERLEKKKGIGRGDETCYHLYKIGWGC